jgi:hypothetical protein
MRRRIARSGPRRVAAESSGGCGVLIVPMAASESVAWMRWAWPSGSSSSSPRAAVSSVLASIPAAVAANPSSSVDVDERVLAWSSFS